jgi:ankyrin repeat protein
MEEIKTFDTHKLHHTVPNVMELPLEEWVQSEKHIFWREIISFCRQGNAERIKEYLEAKKFDLHSEKALDVQPLCHALEAKQYDVVRVLVDHGAPLNVRNGSGRHPLSYAWDNDEGVVQLLLDKGADVNQTSSFNGCTTLCSAVHSGVLRLLIARGANVNLTNITGATALHFAAILNQMEKTRILVEEGVPPHTNIFYFLYFFYFVYIVFFIFLLYLILFYFFVTKHKKVVQMLI